MPVILNVPQDPTDLVLQGEQMRAAAMAAPFGPWGAPFGGGSLYNPAAPTYTAGAWDSNYDDDTTATLQVLPGAVGPFLMVGDNPIPVVESTLAWANTRANAGIATPTGAFVPVVLGLHLMSVFVQATQVWQISGVTRDSAGTPVGNCRVWIFEVGRMTVPGAPIVAQTTSDGSGNYSAIVPLNTNYQVLAYHDGTPDTAGATIDTITPTAV